MFTRREIEAADKSRELYGKVGRPAQDRYESYLENNAIINCPVTVQDTKRAVVIYGPDVGTLKGRSTKDKPSIIPIFEPITLPDYILQHHKHIELSVDFYYVQGQVFLLSKSKKIKLLTSTNVNDRSKDTQLKVHGLHGPP